MTTHDSTIEMDAMNAEHIPLDKATRIAFASSKGDGFTRWTELAVYYLNMPEFGRKQWLTETKGCSSEPGEVTKRRAIQTGTLARGLKALIDTDSDLGRIVAAEAEEWEEEQAASQQQIVEYKSYDLPGQGATTHRLHVNSESYGQEELETLAHALGGRIIDSAGEVVYDHRKAFPTASQSPGGADAPSANIPSFLPVIAENYLRNLALGVFIKDEVPEFATDLEALQWLYGNPDAGYGYPAMIERDFGVGESTTRAALKNGTPVKVPLRAVLKWFDREAFRRDRKGDE